MLLYLARGLLNDSCKQPLTTSCVYEVCYNLHNLTFSYSRCSAMLVLCVCAGPQLMTVSLLHAGNT